MRIKIFVVFTALLTAKNAKNVELQYIIETPSLVDLGRIMADTVDIF